jgi:hypothetical protein
MSLVKASRRYLNVESPVTVEPYPVKKKVVGAVSGAGNKTSEGVSFYFGSTPLYWIYL